MGTLDAESGEKRDMDDSGCVEDESTPMKTCKENGYCGSAELLDLSDDVLLYILKYCSPLDLKSLGYTCSRLGTLIRDRTLWQTVDARGQPSGRARLRWMLEHCLNAGTKELLLSGYAKQAEGCQGLVNRTRQEVNEAEKVEQEMSQQSDASESSDTTSAEGEPSRQLEPPYPLFRQHARLHLTAQPLSRCHASPVWFEKLSELSDKVTSSDGEAPTTCPGPQFTLTQSLLKQLRSQCSKLTALALDYCNINCDSTGINHFPATLKKLSLRGTKCYNLNKDGFLYKIQDFLPLLEELDVSECCWLEPAVLLPLSKLRELARLHMSDCPRMSEFVAYCAIATRYGFPSLQMIDLRGSPVSDSEVSSLGWVRSLRELRVAAPPPPRRAPAHVHCRGDALPACSELAPWELQEPPYFKANKTDAVEEDAGSDIATKLDDLLEQIAADGAGCVNECAHTQGVRIVVRPRDGYGEIRRMDGFGDDSRPGDRRLRIEEVARVISRHRIGEMEARSFGVILAEPVARPGNIEARPMERIGNILRERGGSVGLRRRVRENGSGDSAEVNENDRGPPPKLPKVDDEGPSQSSNITVPSTNRNEHGLSSKEPRPDDKKPKPQYVTIKRRSDFQIDDEKPSKSNNITVPLTDKNKSGPSPKKTKLDDEKTKPQYITIKRRSDFQIDDEKPSKSNNIAVPSTDRNESGPSPKESRLDDEKPKPQYVTIKRRSDFQIDDDKPSKSNNITLLSTDRNESGPSPKEPSLDDDEPKPQYVTIKRRSDFLIDDENPSKSNNITIPSLNRNEPVLSLEETGSDDEKPKPQYVTFKRSNDFNIDDVAKIMYQSDVNEGASTSKNYSFDKLEKSASINNQNETKHCGDVDVSKEQLDSNVSNASDYDDDVSNCSKANNRGSSPSNSVDSVDSSDRQRRPKRFQQNQEPVVIQCSVAARQNQQPENSQNNENPHQNNDDPQEDNENRQGNQDAEPRHQVVYVNVGQQINSVYRLWPNRVALPDVINQRNFNVRGRNFYIVPPATPSIDLSLLVSDLAVSTFGRADGENDNYIHIGPNAAAGVGMRPTRSNLRVLSMTGFRNITDRSLVHLATAAPHLRSIDFSRTSVTQRGVENFKSLRPDCEVIYSPYTERNETTD